MEEESVRASAEEVCEALRTGNVDAAITHLSDELKRNLGEVIALFPLPATEVTVDSLEHSGPGFNVVLRFVGETEEVLVQTRWKDRNGVPKVVEVSHLSRELTQPQEGEETTEAGEPPE